MIWQNLLLSSNLLVEKCRFFFKFYQNCMFIFLLSFPFPYSKLYGSVCTCTSELKFYIKPSIFRPKIDNWKVILLFRDNYKRDIFVSTTWLPLAKTPICIDKNNKYAYCKSLNNFFSWIRDLLHFKTVYAQKAHWHLKMTF